MNEWARRRRKIFKNTVMFFFGNLKAPGVFMTSERKRKMSPKIIATNKKLIFNRDLDAAKSYK